LSKPLEFILVKTAIDLARCAALIIPGGESTTIARIAETSKLLEPLREFVKVDRRPTWGTCAGMILLSESANRTKAGGQELIGGLSVRVNRNHFGRQRESFAHPLDLKFLKPGGKPFTGVFIRAPIVEAILPRTPKPEEVEVHAPEKSPKGDVERQFTDDEVEVLVSMSRKLVPAEGMDQADRPLNETSPNIPLGNHAEEDKEREKEKSTSESSIVAVRQGNVIGTSFHPELTGDTRMHRWWLEQVLVDLEKRAQLVQW